MKNTATELKTLTLEEMNDIAKAGKNLGRAASKNSEDFDEVFDEIREAAEGVKSVFHKLRDRMDHNDFIKISQKAEHLGKLLENNEIIGRQIKTAGNVAIDLAKDIVNLGGAILAGRFGALPSVAKDIAVDLVYSGKLLIQAAHSFKTYYKAKLKPKFIKMREKIDKQEEKMKEEFKILREKLNHKEEKIKEELKHFGQIMDEKVDEAGHWFEKRFKTKDKVSKKQQSKEIIDEKGVVPLDDSEVLVSIRVDTE